MKPNVIVSLLVGLVVGFTMGTMVSGPRTDQPSPVAAAHAAARASDESIFAVKSSDMPAGTFTGMTDESEVRGHEGDERQRLRLRL